MSKVAVKPDISIAYTEWNADKRGIGPSILMVHATGFHGRIWDEIVGHLGERHIIAIDQRGHGNSTKLPANNWREFAEDLIALITLLELEDLVGVGHSMGGHVLLDAAGLRPDLFTRLVAIDPTIAEPKAYEDPQPMFKAGEKHPAARRKNRFASPQEMIDRFKDRSPYSLFTPATLKNYCEHGLLKTPEGDYELACPPELEANVYITSRTNGAVYESMAALMLPTLLIRAHRKKDAVAWDFTNSSTWPDLISVLQNGTEIYLEDRTHFVPMEIPEQIAEMITDFIS